MMMLKRVICFLFTLSALNSTAQGKGVNFKQAHIHIAPNFSEKMLQGEVTFTFDAQQKTDTIYLDAQNLAITQVTLNEKPVAFWNTNKQLKIAGKYKKQGNILQIQYQTQPKQTVYFIEDDAKDQIWTQGQGKYTSHWVPSFDDVNQKLVFNLSISYPESYQVIANGILKSTAVVDGIKTWHYQMQNPMSSYLLMFAIGDFVKQEAVSASGIPLHFYLQAEDAAHFGTTYKHSQQLFNFLEKQIGVPYPWEVYQQVPAQDFLYGGMENTSATVFSQDFVVDAIGAADKTYYNVNAHELAHQWFGNLVTAASSEHHWLQEGFATYYALLAEQDLFGKDYFDFKLYEMAEQLILAQQRDKEPILSAKASSLTFYQKGAWALHYLKNQIGEKAFNLAVKNYLTKYQFQSATTDQFLAEVTLASGYNTTDFKKRWLASNVFPTEDAFAILTQNPNIVTYLEIGNMYDVPLAEKKAFFLQALQSDLYSLASKEEILYQLGKEKPEDLVDFFPIIEASTDVKLRQVFVRSLGKVSEGYKAFYEGFLNDPSYITQEIVLQNLWTAFPNDRTKLLNQTKTWQGFQDKNLRITWLTLALLTDGYENASKIKFYNELLAYTTNQYESSVRQNAIVNLLFLNANDTNVLEGLVSGLQHHKWQFVQFCKNTIREQLKSPKYKIFYTQLVAKLAEPEKTKLQQLLNEKEPSVN
ncbi:M1 family metallopeptidase [Flavobacterium agricola]|uniref:Aminopeptidase N n=1 Tax=Flavobacterium agricola TaxID=2870839 RepID=A0ABY6M3S6_9FLAO|nr:M1 family metallopeptidase [Flavobacterium agricola]UYW01881.1 M1 family metallopeptidase [Flavobacterium agricola]